MIGDQYISSWLNTVIYGCSLVVAIFKWKNLKHSQAPLQEQYFWLFIIFILSALGINKQLNLQTLFINIGRHIAQYEGWTEKRRLFQSWFAYTFSGIVICAVLIIIVSVRKLWRHNLLALVGLSILCFYTVMRTTSICHVGFVAESSNVGEFRLTDIIEFFGILGIFINAVMHYKKE
jgi:hypothetical protein